MNKVLEEHIEEICTTKMPDNEYPAFTLIKTQDLVQAQLSWHGLVATAIGAEEDDIVEEALLAFTNICVYLFK